MSVTRLFTMGEVAEMSATLAGQRDASTLVWKVMDPVGNETDVSGSIVHDGSGKFHVDVQLTSVGIWRWRVTTDGPIAVAEGTIECVSEYVGGVTDPRDLRVLIPACRRAIDGPSALSPDSPSTTLDDPAVLGLIADATAELILLTHGDSSFGYQLLATQRDPFYLAPTAWITDTERKPAADAAILSQAALNHYFWLIKMVKVSETLKNEAVSWEYNLSANVIAGWMNFLIANRDRAIESLQAINAPMEMYVSLVAERDRIAAAWLEPWVTEIGAPVPYVGGGGSGPLEYDYRFNTWG